jgi:hypothetical protein
MLIYVQLYVQLLNQEESEAKRSQVMSDTKNDVKQLWIFKIQDLHHIP